MELKDFIKRSLLDVVDAVEEANTKKNRFRLNSHVTTKTDEIGQKIEFDISVIVDKSSDSNANGAIKVAFASFGGGIKELEASQYTHKIKFDIFVTDVNR